MSLTVDPPALEIAAAGGVATHNLINGAATRLAFKVKSTNNENYRLKPVYGFVEPGASAPVEITRTAGPPKEDKLVFQFIEAGPEVTDAAAHFKANAPQGEVELPVNAV